MTNLAYLPSRGVIAVAGPDRVSFLQGLVSNDVALVAPGRAVWAALLTPQGKWLSDFFILADGERLLLDCEAAQAAELAKRLSRYRLRAQASVAVEDWAVHAAWGGPAPDSPPDALVVAPDPRLPEAGWRVLAPAPVPGDADAAAYDRHRLALGLPDGSRDMEAEKSVLLEAGFDELSGVSWTKGCYMGQELTARTKYRGLIKRRLMLVAGAADLPVPGTPVLQDGVEVGVMRSSAGAAGLALMRLEVGDGLESGGVPIRVSAPGWMGRLPGQGA